MERSERYMDEGEYAEYDNEYDAEVEEMKMKKRSKDYDFGQKDINLLGSMDVKFGLGSFDNIKIPNTDFEFGGLSKSKKRR